MINKCPFITFFFIYKMAEEEAIKVKRTPVHLEIINHSINPLNINVIEGVNVKSQKIFLWLVSLYAMIYSRARL